MQRALTIGQVFLVAVMAANATSGLSSKEAAGFGAAYGGVRAILALQYIRVRRLGDCRSFVRRRIAGLISAALIWAGSALLPAPQRYAGWAVALLIDIGNSWPPARITTAFPPGATHFPERFGLLTTILLGEFVASVMRGIETQMGWSFLAASAAVLSLGLGFAIWSCYSDGASAWETRHVRSRRDVARLRMWIALHFALFVGIGILGVAVRRAIALPSGGHFSTAEQWITCSATAGIICVIMGLAATSEHHDRSRSRHVWAWQFAVAILALTLSPFTPQIIASMLLFILFLCFLGQTALLIANQRLAPVARGADPGSASRPEFLSRRHGRRLQRGVVLENNICNLTRLIAFEVEPLRREVNRFEGVLSLGRRQTFLAASDRTAQCKIKRRVDPNLQVELIAIRRFEEKNPLQQKNVDIPEDVVVLPISDRLCITTIRDNIDTTLISQRKD